MKVKNFKKGEGGFALLFSVLIASLLLSVGLSIFNITLKELSISTASRQSVTAFYAADSGREQALFNDLKLGKYTFIAGVCKADIGTCSGSGSVLPLDNEGPSFDFTITKEQGTTKIEGIDVDVIITNVTSNGKNVSFGDRIEREIKQSY